MTQQDRRKALLVEDHPRMRRLLGDLVDHTPQLVLEAAFESAEAALDYINGNKPEFVLADISLPGMSGIDMIKELHTRFGSVPCLVVSGHTQASYVEAAKSAGAKGFVDKSEPETFHEALASVINGNEYWQQVH